ncbi:SRPBCC domain-containing protein [bacterium]|nr:MAG: Polyketide cyclase / dehydrase and lipid transport [Candidatus Hinthialibacteria bacterium OLB16]MCK6495392.1 SRPBCC domain-containing protein [bacterium]
MIRTVNLPCEPAEAYSVLTDPIRLAAWLNVTSATTGIDIFHVFEVVEKKTDPAWQVRGVVVHYETDRQIQVEARETDHAPKGPLTFTIEPEGERAVLQIEWEQRFILPLVERMIDPQSVIRLELISQKLRKGKAFYPNSTCAEHPSPA